MNLVTIHLIWVWKAELCIKKVDPVKKKKKKSKFPDHSGDGKITKKDILMAKGVIPKTKKKNA